MATDIHYLVNRRNKIEEKMQVLAEKDRNDLSNEDMVEAISLANEHASLTKTFSELSMEMLAEGASV